MCWRYLKLLPWRSRTSNYVQSDSRPLGWSSSVQSMTERASNCSKTQSNSICTIAADFDQKTGETNMIMMMIPSFLKQTRNLLGFGAQCKLNEFQWTQNRRFIEGSWHLYRKMQAVSISKQVERALQILFIIIYVLLGERIPSENFFWMEVDHSFIAWNKPLSK